MSIDTTPQEIALIQGMTQQLRQELMLQAHRGAIGMGFQDKQARFIAVTMTLLGAAQLYGLSIHGGEGMYEIFKAMCAVMAGSNARDVVRGSVMELGDEAKTPGLILPT